jgi:3-methylfumaryl-CoA hydratase
MSPPLDMAHLREWIGAEETATERLDAGLIERFCATLSDMALTPDADGTAPRLIHFCLCQPAAPMAALGEDGHPARGSFLPPVPLPRRMWAGSAITFHGDLKAGDLVSRRSRITDVVVKQGRTGALCFVTVDHEFAVGGDLRVADRQTLVYRAIQPGPAASQAPETPTGAMVLAIDPSPTLLFRYSALTFNGHRIHYDADYTRDVEGYPGLVVHGPLQATLLFHLAAQQVGRQPDRFAFKSLATLYSGEAMHLHAGSPSDDALSVWTASIDGRVAMQAQAGWS